MTTVSIGFRLADTPASIQALLKEMVQIYRLPDGAGWSLDISHCDFVGPYAIAIIAAAVLNAKTRSQEPRIVFPQAPPPLVAFMHFSGLQYLMGQGDVPDIDHPDNETMPLHVFKANESILNTCMSVMRLIRRHLDNISIEFEDGLLLCIREVLQNVEDHSHSTFGGLVSARCFVKRREICVGIVDQGWGIWRTLADHHSDVINPVVALQRVIEGQYTSGTKPHNRGMGISNLCLHVRNIGGEAFIVSGNALASLRQSKQWGVSELTEEFPGTAVFFKLPIGDGDEVKHDDN